MPVPTLILRRLKVLQKINPNAEFDLVDISKAMKGQFDSEMRKVEGVNYHLSDIIEFQSDKKYDLFFSSRALEYLENKETFFKKIFSMMKDGAKGVIVTKNKDYVFRKKNDKRFQHQGQLSLSECKELISKAGFSEVEVCPVIIRVPILDRFATKTAERIFNNNIDRQLDKDSFFLNKMTESFLVKFSK